VHYDAPVRACVRQRRCSVAAGGVVTPAAHRDKLSASIDIRDRVRARPAAPRRRRRPVIAAAAAVAAVVDGASPETT